MESRTSLGRSALSSGAVLHDRVTGLHCVGMAIEEYGTAAGRLIPVPEGFTSLHSDRVLCGAVQWHNIVKIQISTSDELWLSEQIRREAIFKSLQQWSLMRLLSNKTGTRDRFCLILWCEPS